MALFGFADSAKEFDPNNWLCAMNRLHFTRSSQLLDDKATVRYRLSPTYTYTAANLKLREYKQRQQVIYHFWVEVPAQPTPPAPQSEPASRILVYTGKSRRLTPALQQC